MDNELYREAVVTIIIPFRALSQPIDLSYNGDL